MSDEALTEQNESGLNSSTGEVTAQNLVTEDHVRAALTADKGAAARLIAWKVVDFTKKGDNFACVVTSVVVKYELDGQRFEVTYVVKLNSCRNMKDMDQFSSILFEKEAQFYQNLAPEMNAILREIGEETLKVPRYIYASLEESKEVLFLEDLRPLGFKMYDKRQGLDKNHITLVLQELAKLHAASILMQAKAPGEDISARYPSLERNWCYLMKTVPLMLSVVELQLKHCKDLLANYEGYDRAISWIDNILPNVPDLIGELLVTSKYKVVCHGDCWNNNLLFRYSEDGHPVETMLLDLQLNCASSPGIDLNYFLYTSTTGEQRLNLDLFLSTYYNSLINVLEASNHKAPFTRAELQQEFKEKNAFGAIFAMVALPFLIMDPEHVIDLDSATDEAFENMMQEMHQKSTEEWDDNPVMRPRFLSMINDMMESGVIPEQCHVPST